MSILIFTTQGFDWGMGSSIIKYMPTQLISQFCITKASDIKSSIYSKWPPPPNVNRNLLLFKDPPLVSVWNLQNILHHSPKPQPPKGTRSTLLQQISLLLISIFKLTYISNQTHLSRPQRRCWLHFNGTWAHKP